MPFKSETCQACELKSPAIDDAELQKFLAEYDQWELQMSGLMRVLERSYKFKDFETAMDFTARVGKLAESENHHPEITLSWGMVKLRWWTHKINDLHRNDLICAAKSDELYSI